MLGARGAGEGEAQRGGVRRPGGQGLRDGPAAVHGPR